MSLRALFGGPLFGSKPVRFIYVDEAGISAKEPISIVVALVVHADTQWRPVARLVQGLRQTIPEKFRNDIFHAKSVWGDKKYRPEWSGQDRLDFLCRLASIPVRARIALAWSAVRRTAALNPPPKYSLAQAQHAYAFMACIASADQYIREACGPEEIATVVAEDVPEMRALLRHSLGIVRLNPHFIDAGYVISPEGSPAKGIEYRVDRVVDEVHFSEKREAIILQVADACAFAIRRYLSNQSKGAELARALLGNGDPDEAFRRQPEATFSGGVLAFQPAKTQPS